MEIYKKRLQESLPAIRAVAGLSPVALAAVLDIGSSTITNIEKHPEKMTTVYYLAIITTLHSLALAEEMENRDPLLQKVIYILVRSNNVPEANRRKLINAIQNARNSISIRNGYYGIRIKVREKIRTLVDEIWTGFC
jgi:hypothetical protein